MTDEKRKEWTDEQLLDYLAGGWPGLETALTTWSKSDSVASSVVRQIMSRAFVRLNKALDVEKAVARLEEYLSKWVSPKVHDKRVSDLIAANNREIERRRNMRRFLDAVLDNPLHPADLDRIKAAARETLDRDRELTK